MLETMYVRCAHCGYDNSPEYRFCGMCGASLAHPPVAPKAAVPPEKPLPPEGGETTNEHIETVHGPSFLGLAEDPKTEFHYLYEDEQPKSHIGLVFLILILMAGAGFLAWQWRNNGYPFNHLSAAGSAPSSASASPSEVAPAQTPDQQTHIDKPMTGVGDQPSRPAEATKQPEATEKSSEQAAAEHPTPPKSQAKDSEAEDEDSATSDKTEDKAEKPTKEEARATPPPVPERSHPKAQPRISNPKPAAGVPAAAVPAAPDADLELVGERYLYGNGLPQNCGRAESSLRTAALHGNSKAQTVLGTMYATGHCVGRDLPTAYRWFARALHQEPQNSRISADLQVLWRQMSPQERQLATGSQ
ncbi:MAG: hypothetical protein JO356_08315 [Acidobacteria bacterium]|nr:hypothetical protein [Acidobacteriota bacterium]